MQSPNTSLGFIDRLQQGERGQEGRAEGVEREGGWEGEGVLGVR